MRRGSMEKNGTGSCKCRRRNTRTTIAIRICQSGRFRMNEPNSNWAGSVSVQDESKLLKLVNGSLEGSAG